MAKELAESGPKPKRATPKAGATKGGAPKKKKLVHVWPDLVSIEAITALMYVLTLSLLAYFVNAPLGDIANPELTPNPSKAPWYFLGLQELLLHMHPSLAGVIVPTVVLVGLGSIPFIDSRRKGTGIWFYSRKGVPIAIFSAIYTWIWELALVITDEFLVVGDQRGIGHMLEVYGVPSWIATIVVPIFFMTLIPGSLVYLVKKRWNADTRETMIALFSFFVASFLILTIIGTAFRGHSMELMWPSQVIE